MSESTLRGEVRELRNELSMIRSLLAPAEASSVPLSRIRVHVERVQGERKPYYLIVKGQVEKHLRMSATRTAMTLTLLLDLEQRSCGLPGFFSTRELALEVFKMMGGDVPNVSQAQEQIRVAIYRYFSFWARELQDVVSAKFDPTLEKLVLAPASMPISIDILSSDPAIEDALPKLGRPPMLDRLRRDKFLFVPAGGGAGERFLHEIYSVPDHLDVVSAYPRLPLITLPKALVEKYGAFDEMASRHELMHRRLGEKSLTFTQIISETALEKMRGNNPESSYSYFSGMTAEENIKHLRYLSELILREPRFRLILTRADIPFFVGTYKADRFGIAVFFRLPDSSQEQSFSSFAIWGDEILQTTELTVYQWLMNHPSTVTDPKAVAKRVRGYCSDTCPNTV